MKNKLVEIIILIILIQVIKQMDNNKNTKLLIAKLLKFAKMSFNISTL